MAGEDERLRCRYPIRCTQRLFTSAGSLPGLFRPAFLALGEGYAAMAVMRRGKKKKISLFLLLTQHSYFIARAVYQLSSYNGTYSPGFIPVVRRGVTAKAYLCMYMLSGSTLKRPSAAFFPAQKFRLRNYLKWIPSL